MAKTAVIDCHECGGSGCKRCRNKGTIKVRMVVLPGPPPKVPQDVEGFVGFRLSAECPYYEGVCVNDGVDQCTHPDNDSIGDTLCAFEHCPFVAAAPGPKEGV